MGRAAHVTGLVGGQAGDGAGGRRGRRGRGVGRGGVGLGVGLGWVWGWCTMPRMNCLSWSMMFSAE